MSESQIRTMRGYRRARGFIEGDRGAKAVMITVRIEPQIMEVVSKLSEKENLPAAAILRRFIDRGMSISPEIPGA